MSGFVRYTCNKKNEPTMREDCKKCPEYNPCGKEGKWCFVGALVADVKNSITLEGLAPNTIISDICKSLAEEMQKESLKRRGLF